MTKPFKTSEHKPAQTIKGGESVPKVDPGQRMGAAAPPLPAHSPTIPWPDSEKADRWGGDPNRLPFKIGGGR
jgi:hypothetical protein